MGELINFQARPSQESVRRLGFAVLTQAIKDLLEVTTSNHENKENISRQAYRYIFSERLYPFSFKSLCIHLGVNSRFIKRRIKEVISKQPHQSQGNKPTILTL